MPSEPAAARRYETLLEHREWVRTLARSLVARAADAEDVEQQTWVAALDAAPEDARSMRAWLATVARNAARKLHRGEGRRRRREESAEPRSPSPSAAALAERAEVHGRVVTAVVGLDEPYREAVLLRYFEGLGVHETAERAGVPLETMRARLRRARDMLRARLGDELGPERPWRLALIALIDPAGRVPHVTAGTGSGTAAAVVGGTLMTTKVIAGVVAAALLVGGIWWTTGNRAPAPAADGVAAAPVSAPVPRPERSRPRAEPAAADVAPTPAASAAEPAAAAPADPAPRRRTIRERLADRTDGIECKDDSVVVAFGRVAAAADVPIVLAREAADAAERAGSPLTLQFYGVTGQVLLDSLTRMNGLAYVIEDERVVITPADRRWDPTKVVVVPPRPAPPPEVVVRGRVTDAAGAAVSGAEILHLHSRDAVVARSNASGDFEVSLRPPLREIQARAPGQVPSLAFTVSADPAKNGTFVLALRGPAGELTVRVVTDAGPAVGASVTFGSGDSVDVKLPDGRAGEQRAINATADAQGVARLTGLPLGTSRIAVWLKGHDAGTRDVEVVEGHPAEVEVRLVPSPSLAEKLAKVRVSGEFKATRMNDVVGYLSTVSGVNIIVMPRAAERIAETPVSLSIKDDTLANALRALCDTIGGVTYEIQGDVVCIDAVKPK